MFYTVFKSIATVCSTTAQAKYSIQHAAYLILLAKNSEPEISYDFCSAFVATLLEEMYSGLSVYQDLPKLLSHHRSPSSDEWTLEKALPTQLPLPPSDLL